MNEPLPTRRSQVARWAREAAPAQVAGVVLVLASALLLLGYSFVPPEQRVINVAASEGFDPGDPGDQAGAPGVDAGTDGEALAGGAVAPSGPAGRQRAAAGSGVAGPAAAPGAASPPLTASDRGVTPTEVRVGFLLLNPGGLDEAGFALGFRTDIEKVVDALVAEVNDTGGINGRRLVAVKRKVDPTSQQDQVAGCAYLLSDQKVFAVVDSATEIYAATQRCYTVDGQTPFTHAYPMSAEFQAEGGGYDIAANRNLTRIAKEWASEARTVGFLKGGEKVGVFTDACEPSNGVIRQTLVPGIEAAGASSVKVVQIDCDPAAAQSQVPNAVLQMKTAGVTHIFMATVYVGVQNFLQNADMQDYHPEYFVSDYDGLINDYFTQNFPESQWDRTKGITTLLFGAKAAGKPMAPGTKRCSDIFERHGLRGISSIEVTDAEASAICEELLITVEAARAAGPDLTRTGWAQAAQNLGTVETATVHSVTFAPGKYSGGDTVVTLEWRKECHCSVQVSDYRPGRY